MGESVDVLQGEPQSMAMIYQLVTQACEQLVHSEYSACAHVKKKRKNSTGRILVQFSKSPYDEKCICSNMFLFFRGGVEA